MNEPVASPLVSVVIPAYNCAWSIGRCLDALLREKDSIPLEIIVVDDGSMDNTLEVLKGYADHITVICQDNAGPGSARNAGVAKASADLIAFMDSDDEIIAGRLRMQLDYMQQHPETVLSFGSVVFSSKPNVPYLSTLNVQEDWALLSEPYRHLLTCGGECIITTAVMLRMECFERAGGFDERFRCGEDTDLWVRLAELGPFAYHGKPMTIVNDTRWDNKLTKSQYVYTDGPRALIEILKRDSKLSPRDRLTAERTTKKSAEMMLRYDWTHRDLRNMREDIAVCRSVFGMFFAMKWHLISLMPKDLGRLLRRTRNKEPGQPGQNSSL